MLPRSRATKRSSAPFSRAGTTSTWTPVWRRPPSLNQPLEAIRGKADVRKMIASIFAPAKRAEFKLLHVFGFGNRVITERLDQWDWDGSGTWQFQLPVCGMFELTEDGKIHEWREYYDNAHWSKHGGPSLVL